MTFLTASNRVRIVTRRRASTLCWILCCRSLSNSACTGLNLAVLTGSTRAEGPPRPILGPRVASFVRHELEQRGNRVTIVDAKDLPLLKNPHFAYASSQVPPMLQDIHKILDAADAYVCITPELNHAPSPGLINVLNHFGSSVFSFKPSAIVTYSAGQWGGTRAAMGLRPVLSELGCLPVSAKIHIPNGAQVLNEDGSPKEEDAHRWSKYCDRCFAQLEWWGQAAKNHKHSVDPFADSPAFQTSPSQRNAP